MQKAQLRALLESHLPRAVGALPVKEVTELLKQGLVTLVDVRAPEVFAHAHIRGAVGFPIDTIEERLAELMMLPAPAVLYCRTGKETEVLAAKLAEAGTPIAYLEGGVLGWESEGYRLERA